MNILGTGLSGLVGSRIMELLSPSMTFKNLSLETGVDITNKKDVDAYFAESSADWVFHLAAYTDVQGAEKEKEHQKESTAWKVNVLATEYIVDNCRLHKKKLLYIDTDYAFDGKSGPYDEDSIPNPQCWYAKTKTEGAKRVLSLGKDGLVVRISNPYRAHPVGKKDFVHKMLERFSQGLSISAPNDSLFVPTFIDDLAIAVERMVTVNAYGIYHVVGSEALSPYQASLQIAHIFNCDSSLVKETTFGEMFTDRAPAPQLANLTQEKIKNLGVHPHTFEEGLIEVKSQESSANERKL